MYKWLNTEYIFVWYLSVTQRRLAADSYVFAVCSLFNDINRSGTGWSKSLCAPDDYNTESYN
jgi:hypothetical protein